VHASALTLRSSLPPSLDVCDHAACTGRLKVISISLYGGNPRYTAGAVRNSEIVRDAFPDWQLWVYIPDPAVNAEYAVPADIKATLEANGARLINVDKATIDAVGFGMNQRFLPAEDATVERFASRDGDSRCVQLLPFCLHACTHLCCIRGRRGLRDGSSRTGRMEAAAS